MFELLRSPSRSASGAILYVTVGTLMVIWAGLWYFYFLFPMPNPPQWQKFACVGTILSGIAIGSIGFLFGFIGRKAKSADNAVGVAPAGPMVAASPIVPIAASTGNPVAVADGRVVSTAPSRVVDATTAIRSGEVNSVVG